MTVKDFIKFVLDHTEDLDKEIEFEVYDHEHDCYYALSLDETNCADNLLSFDL